MSQSILSSCENFILGIQGESDWSGISGVHDEAAELGDRCVKWLTADHKDHEDFPSMVDSVFAMLKECYQRKILNIEEARSLRNRARQQIQSFSQDLDEDLLDFLRYNTTLQDSDDES